jgi:potassium efflux system protein
VELWSATQTVVEEITVKDGATLLESRDRMVPITLADLLLCLITVIMTTVGAKNIPGLLKLSVLQRVRPGNQYAVATLTQYAIVLVGTIMAFSAIGIGWSKVQWLLAAVSLGLGFGLQEIFANFVSGLIILFEQPIRVGDFVTVGDVSGEVTRIRIRATTVRNLQRQELIVPNKSFITGQIINWTLTDTINRIVIHVGIAYGSDVDLARSILLRVAKENKYVVAEPTPKAIFKQFADSALLFELRIFINNLDHWPRALDSMHSAIDAEFRSVQATLPIEMDQGDVVDDPQHIDAKRRTSSS